MSEYEKCPFCGETEMLKAVVSQERPGVQSGFIECDNCGARGQTQYGSCDPDEMLSLVWYGWNERVPASPTPNKRVEELEAFVRAFKAWAEGGREITDAAEEAEIHARLQVEADRLLSKTEGK